MTALAAIAAFLTTLTEVAIVVGLLAWTIHSFLKVVGGTGGSKGFDNYIVNFFVTQRSAIRRHHCRFAHATPARLNDLQQ